MLNTARRGAYETIRVIWACMKKEVKSSLTEKATMIQCVTLPVGYLLLLGLFVLSGSNAPTAVVMQEHGEYAQAFYQAMGQAHSFQLLPLSSKEATARYRSGTLAAVVTIPADFDRRIAQGQIGHVSVLINNLNQDLTDDVRRAMRLTETTFDANMFPGNLSIVAQEKNAYQQDTDYLPFLSISILVISLMVTGLLLSGMGSARELEMGTIKELLLAPSAAWMMISGKILGSFVLGLVPVGVVLLVVMRVMGDMPRYPLLMVGISLLILLVFVAAGTALGMLMKKRINLATVTRAVSVPLFFLSGVFGPITYLTWPVQAVARAFPTHYGIVLEQLAFKGFTTNTLGLFGNIGLLCGFLALFIVLAIRALCPTHGVTH